MTHPYRTASCTCALDCGTVINFHNYRVLKWMTTVIS